MPRTRRRTQQMQRTRKGRKSVRRTRKVSRRTFKRRPKRVKRQQRKRKVGGASDGMSTVDLFDGNDYVPKVPPGNPEYIAVNVLEPEGYYLHSIPVWGTYGVTARYAKGRPISDIGLNVPKQEHLDFYKHRNMVLDIDNRKYADYHKITIQAVVPKEGYRDYYEVTVKNPGGYYCDIVQHKNHRERYPESLTGNYVPLGTLIVEFHLDPTKRYVPYEYQSAPASAPASEPMSGTSSDESIDL